MGTFVKQGDKVLIVTSGKTTTYFQDFLNEVKHAAGDSGEVYVENVDVLLRTNRNPSSTDIILAGYDNLFTPNDEILKKCFEILKSQGSLVFRESIKELKDSKANYKSKLKLNGFLLKSSEDVPRKMLNECESEIFEVIAEKPSYEIGSSVPVSFAKNSRNVWKLEDDLDDNLINEDDLLDESDIKKPEVSSLRVCSTTGKRKACKDCSCGLAEELNDTTSNQVEKSSCGSCYLGDAFRCASCPYLGMPAFKPGEKIVLAESQLINL